MIYIWLKFVNYIRKSAYAMINFEINKNQEEEKFEVNLS